MATSDSQNVVLGIDIGGSGMKAGLVDVSMGTMASDRRRIATPVSADPGQMSAVVAELVEHFDWNGPLGCTFPGVVRGQSVIETAANLNDEWIGVDASVVFENACGSPVVMINDADAAGLAEMRAGAGVGAEGLVFMLTIGTGLGTALFNRGVLVPNTELGHIEIDGVDAELRASSRARETEQLSFDVWAKRVERYLNRIEDLLWPDLFIIGGGISKSFEGFAPMISTRAPMVPAALRNHAGIVGAALAAT